jgi:hypothetical protein
VDDGHEILESPPTPERPVPEGRLCTDQVEPPSEVVRSPLAGVPKKPVGPPAKHVETDGQEMSKSQPSPEGMLWLVQVAPPSVVTSIKGVKLNEVAAPAVPAAKHVVTDGHAMASIPPAADGNDWLVHVAPPSVVAIRVVPVWELPEEA